MQPRLTGGPGRPNVTRVFTTKLSPKLADSVLLGCRAGPMADALQKSGFTDEEITTMIVANSGLLAGPQAQDGTR
jgi:hypothetical protein